MKRIEERLYVIATNLYWAVNALSAIVILLGVLVFRGCNG